MAQSNFEERIDTYEIESTNVMTGDRDRSRYLYYQLKMSMAKAKRIDIIVSFLMESGVRMLLNDMKRALDRGVKIRILTGNYLGITQPSALYLIKSELGDRVDLRLYNETSRSFHPKSYIFHYESSNEIYIGSSNISKSALTSGMSQNDITIPADIRIDLRDEDWYTFNDNFGTSEEKAFVAYFRDYVDKLKAIYSKVYLMRNERQMHIYSFEGGERFEPDYVLFLQKDKTDGFEQFQVFIEPKGAHLVENDKWKEDFLLQLKESAIPIKTFADDNKYHIWGFHFFNRDAREKEFSFDFEVLRSVNSPSKIAKYSELKTTVSRAAEDITPYVDKKSK